MTAEVPLSVERVRHDGGRGPLPDGGVGSEHGDAERLHLFDLAAEEVQLPDRRRLAHVANPRAAGARESRELRVVAQVVVEPGVHVQPSSEGIHHVEPRFRGKPSAVGREPDHEVRRRNVPVARDARGPR